MLGSIAAAVVSEALCDVLIVQREQERRSTPT